MFTLPVHPRGALEQVKGIEPSSTAWQAVVLTVILHLHMRVISYSPEEVFIFYNSAKLYRYFGEYINLRRPNRTFSLHTFKDAVFGKGTNSYILAHLIGLEPMTYRLEGDCYYPSELKMYIM